MITVEFSSERRDVGLVFDKAGAELLIEILEFLKSKEKADHVHLSSGPEVFNGIQMPPESFALSTNKINPRADLQVSDLVTLVFKP
jgi:hypothetical protein